MNGKSKVWALALLLGVLLVGGVAGAAVDRVLIGRPTTAETRERRDGDRDRRGRYLDRLVTELELTEEQRAEIEILISRHHEQLTAQWREMRTLVEEHQGQLRAAIREVLRPEQLPAYEALLEKESRRHRHRSGRTTPPDKNGRP